MAETMPEALARRVLLGSRDHYSITVEGVGSFKCRRRGFFDDARVEVEAQEYLRSLGVTDMRSMLPSLESTGRVYGTLKVSIVEAPQGWKLDDAVSTQDMLAIYGAIEAEEASFRRTPEGPRTGDAARPAPAGAPVGVSGVPTPTFQRGDRKPDA